jgi:hypothetical protein
MRMAPSKDCFVIRVPKVASIEPEFTANSLQNG